MTNVIRVAAALIKMDKGYLLCKRPRGKSNGGMWEFPGGKLEPGETPQQALEREIREELLMNVRAGEILSETVQEAEDRQINISLIACRAGDEPPVLAEHEEMVFAPWDEIPSYGLCPADRVLWEITERPGTKD